MRYWQLLSRTPLMAPEDEGAGGSPPAAEAPTPGEAPADGDAPAADAPLGADAGEPDDPAPEPAKPRVPWYNKRIDGLTAAQKAEKERADAAEARARQAEERAAAYEALYGKPDGAPPVDPAAAAGEKTYTQSELQAEAARIAAVNALNQRVDTLYDAGAKAHAATWGARVQAAANAFGQDLVKRPDFFEALTGLDNGADVYHELTADLDQMADILALPPLRLGMELAKLSAKVAAKPKGPGVSKAPAPIDPVGGGGGGEPDLSKVDMNEYSRIREKQRAERYAARR